VSAHDHLIRAAREARERARAPFSHFQVGAAVEDENGLVFTGCNFENSSYGLTMCAERVALFKALSEGAAKVQRIAIVAETDILTPPCGACRQTIWDLCGDVELILSNLSGKREIVSLKEIFPRPFDVSLL